VSWEDVRREAREVYLTVLSLKLRRLLAVVQEVEQGERAMAKSKAEAVEFPHECTEGSHRTEPASELCAEFEDDHLKGRDSEWFHEHVLGVENTVREAIVQQAVTYVIRELLSVEFLELIEAVEARDDDDELQEVYSTWRSTTKSKDAIKAAEKQAEAEAAAV
jgi:hypothetical protein